MTPEQIARFWAKVDRRGADECWIWTACRNDSGYGAVLINGKTDRAHRVSARIAGMDIDEQCVLHRCDNRLCVNPAHLFVGDRTLNAADKVSKGRVPHGEEGPNSRLTRAQVLDILARLSRGETQSSLAAEHGVHPSTISKLAHGHSWARTQQEALSA